MNDLIFTTRNNFREKLSYSVIKNNSAKSIPPPNFKNNNKDVINNLNKSIKGILNETSLNQLLNSSYVKSENKLMNTKINILIKNEDPENYYDVSKIVNSNRISDNLKNKFSEVLNEAVQVDKNFMMERKNYIQSNKNINEMKNNKINEMNYINQVPVNKNTQNMNKNRNHNDTLDKTEKINLKKQEIFKLLDINCNSDNTNKNNVSNNENILKTKNAFTQKILDEINRLNGYRKINLQDKKNIPNTDSKIKKLNRRSISQDNINIPLPKDKKESTERIIKMQNKLEKLIDGEFLLTELIEKEESFNLRSTRSFKESLNFKESAIMNRNFNKALKNYSNNREDNIYNLNYNFFNENLDKKDSSNNSDFKKILDFDYNEDRDKVVTGMNQMNNIKTPENKNDLPNFRESPINTNNRILKKNSSLNIYLSNNENDFNRNEDNSKIENNFVKSNRRTQSAFTELLPLRKEIINIDNDENKSNSFLL